MLYNSVLFLFGTPLNRLFLLYVAMLGLTLWSAGTVLTGSGVRGAVVGFPVRLPAHAIAIYIWLLATFNALAWMKGIVPALLGNSSPAFLAGTGLLTSRVYVQDLSIWIPLMVVGAGWLWRGRAWGCVVVGALLTMTVLESVSIAFDQWFGHAADPGSPAVSVAVVPLFSALAVIGLVALYAHLRCLVAR